MTGFTITGRTTFPDAVGGPVGAAVLTDGTLLVAANHDVDGGDTLNVWHLRADLSTISTATLPAVFRLDALVATPDGNALAVTTTGEVSTARRITTDPTLGFATLGALPTTVPPWENFNDWSPAPVIGPDGHVHILRPGWHHVITTTGTQVAAGGVAWGNIVTPHPSGHAVNDTGQAWTFGHNHTATAPEVGSYALAATDPSLDQWVFVSQDGSTGGQNIYDGQTGTILSTYGVGGYRWTSGAAASDGKGGAISITYAEGGPSPAPDVAYLDHVTPDGQHTHTVHEISDNSSWNGGQSIACLGGRWLCVTVTATGVGANQQLNIWTGTVPTDGVLHVDTLSHPWWLVGTRDPSMHYELLVDTPLGWVREIVAGEESLATHELMVSDGMEWHEAALFRPET